MSRIKSENRTLLTARAIALYADAGLADVAAAITAGADGQLAWSISYNTVRALLAEAGVTIRETGHRLARIPRPRPDDEELVELYMQIGWTDGVVLAVRARGGSVTARQVRAAMVAAGYRTKGAA